MNRSVIIDKTNRKVIVDGIEIKLRKKELDIAMLLDKIPLNKSYISKIVCGNELYIRAIDVHICKLRKLLGGIEYIITRNIGNYSGGVRYNNLVEIIQDTTIDI